MEYVYEILKTEYGIFLWLAAAVVTVITFLASIKTAYELYEWIRGMYADNPDQVNFSKRAFLVATGGVTVISLVWVNGKKFYTDYKNSTRLITADKNSGLVAHKKTGTIHLAGVSEGTLPSEKWATKKIDLVRYSPYAGYESTIYEAVGKEAITQRNDELTIYAYLLAIKSSPLSYHLYDKLARVFGRRKEYSEILKLYEDALLSVKSMDLNKRKRKRAMSEFSARVAKTKKRALLS